MGAAVLSKISPLDFLRPSCRIMQGKDKAESALPQGWSSGEMKGKWFGGQMKVVA